MPKSLKTIFLLITVISLALFPNIGFEKVQTAEAAASWSTLGSGMNGEVFASTVYNGNLIVAGKFTTAGGVPANYIAQWNGASWSALGSGMQGGWAGHTSIYALSVYNGNLIAGGDFDTAGGVSAKNIAQWNGTSWSALDSGLDGIYGWGVYSLTVYNNNLIAGGSFFTTAGGISVNQVAQWNGASWSGLGSGMDTGAALALSVYNGNLIAGGDFTAAGGVSANHIARWNGTSWSALGSGINGREVTNLTVYNNSLIAGGEFTTAGGVSAKNIAQWNGTSWSALGSGMNDGVETSTVYNNSLIAGGRFTTAGGISANRIAQWNGTSWSALGSGMNDRVYNLTVYNNSLIAGGVFTTAGGISANRIAQWVDIPTLSTTLIADPPSGVAPLSDTLTATASGTATGTLNYTFWWNCTNTSNSVSEVTAVCGDPTNSANGAKYDSVSVLTQVALHTYAEVGNYRPKVIVERGAATPVTEYAQVVVSAASTPTPTPTLTPTPTPTFTPTLTPTPIPAPSTDCTISFEEGGSSVKIKGSIVSDTICFNPRQNGLNGYGVSIYSDQKVLNSALPGFENLMKVIIGY